jgi:hypothetical protein
MSKQYSLHYRSTPEKDSGICIGLFNTLEEANREKSRLMEEGLPSSVPTCKDGNWSLYIRPPLGMAEVEDDFIPKMQYTTKHHNIFMKFD